MSMTEIVSNMNLDFFPILGLVMFLVAFGLVLVGVVKRSKSDCQHGAHLPLTEDNEPITRGNAREGVNHG